MADSDQDRRALAGAQLALSCTEGIVIGMLALALATATATATSTADTERTLPMPAWMFGAIAIVTFASLLAITYAFRSVGTKHSTLSEGS